VPSAASARPVSQPPPFADARRAVTRQFGSTPRASRRFHHGPSGGGAAKQRQVPVCRVPAGPGYTTAPGRQGPLRPPRREFPAAAADGFSVATGQRCRPPMTSLHLVFRCDETRAPWPGGRPSARSSPAAARAACPRATPIPAFVAQLRMTSATRSTGPGPAPEVPRHQPPGLPCRTDCRSSTAPAPSRVPRVAQAPRGRRRHTASALVSGPRRGRLLSQWRVAALGQAPSRTTR